MGLIDWELGGGGEKVENGRKGGKVGCLVRRGKSKLLVDCSTLFYKDTHRRKARTRRYLLLISSFALEV